MTNPNIDVQKQGQSFWYDNIQRGIIASGELKELIGQYGVLGITSNPSIFEKAITSSGDYDADVIALVDQNADTKSIYEHLAISDIQAAADMLEPVYEQTNGVDGYISLEVSPTLAHDTQGTIEEARRLYAAVARKNLMVKVPSTPEGVPAIQQLISDGININVTLIFSLENYEAVARAYLAGLQARAERGEALNIASVASFFVSRVDVLVDKQLDEKIAVAESEERKAQLAGLKAKAAIANAKVAYAAFKRIFGEAQFSALKAKGARPQRVLWASTSTKNPAYKDTYYAEALIGPDTVNTLPPATLKAFADHGVVARTLDKDLGEAEHTLEALAAAGISMPEVWQKLQDDGVKLFADAFGSLMKGMEGKRSAIHARGVGSNLTLAAGYVDEVIKLKAASKVWAHDPSLWTDQPEHTKVIANRLGWLTVADHMLEQLPDLLAYRDEVTAKGMTEVVVLGMGGSSLAPDVLRVTFGADRTSGGLRLHVLDTTDATTVLTLERQLDLSKTLFVVSSKSGGTLEVNAFYKYFRAKVDTINHDESGAHFIAITDEGTSLQALAASEGFGKTFINPTDIGGRYSALSYFGLVPALLAGIDIGKLLKRAVQMAGWCRPDSASNPGLWLGALMGGMALGGRDKISFIIDARIYTFGYWVEQLIAESTGKQDRGIVPVEGDLADGRGPLKVSLTDLGDDRFYIYMKLAGAPSDAADATEKLVAALKKAGAPVVEMTLADVYDLGAEFFRWEFATAVAGSVIGVNPFDEPNVTESKQNTRKLLDEYEGSGEFATEQDSKSPNGQINKLVRLVKPGDYMAIQAYLPYTPEVAEGLTKMRVMLRDRTGVPVTVGYGPRFLHSTGQLHKGGANNVVAVQLTYEPEDEALIPGEPFSFATLIRGQALGDFESLNAHGRRAIRLHLGDDIGAGFKKILKVLNNGAKRARSGRSGSGRSGSERATSERSQSARAAGRVSKSAKSGSPVAAKRSSAKATPPAKGSAPKKRATTPKAKAKK